MKLLVILLALVGLCVCVANSHHHQGQCNDVQQQWSATFDDDDDHTALEQFARAFLTKFFQKSPEALQLFDGEGNTQSPEFRAHAVRLIRRMNEEMEQLDDDSSEEHNHDEGAPLINTTPAIREAFQASILETLPTFIEAEMDAAVWSGCLEQIISCLLL